MLEATLNKASILKDLVERINIFAQVANFECNESGIYFQGRDNSSIAGAVTAVGKLDGSGFQHYQCRHPISFGVGLDLLAKILGVAKEGDKCSIKATAEFLILIYESPYDDRIEEYKIKVLDTNTNLPNIPDINYAACATLLSSDFTQIIHDLRLSFNDSIHITLSKEGAQFFTKNKSLLLEQNDIACQLFKKHMDQNSRGKKKAKKYNPAKGQLGNIGVDIKMPQNCQYTMSLSINYFVGMISKCPLSDTVQLMFENDLPFLVLYTFREGYIRYYLKF